MRNGQAPLRTVIPPKRQKDDRLKKQGDEKNREKPTSEENLPHKSDKDASGKDAGSKLNESAETKQTSLLPPGKPHEQPIATHSTSESGHRVQPISNIADSRSPANTQGEAESAAAPINSAPRTAESGKQEGGNDSASGERIAAAPQSAVKAQALAQAQLINNDCMQSESQVSQIAAARRQQVNTYFSGARQSLSQVFITSVIAVQTFIAGRQTEIIAAVARTLAWIRTAITGALQAAQTIAGQIRARINQILQSITTSVQNRVVGIAGQITGLIDSIPLPDIPGIGQIRARAVSMLNGAAGAVSGAFGRFFQLRRSGIQCRNELAGFIFEYNYTVCQYCALGGHSGDFECPADDRPND